MCESEVIAWTDASLTGFGITIIDGNSISVIAGPFLFYEDIQILEGRALLRLAQVLPPQHDPKRISVLIDNTSLEGATIKRRANNFVLNSIVGRIITIFTTKNWIPTIQHVESKRNFADGPSRWQHSSTANAWYTAALNTGEAQLRQQAGRV